MRIAIVNDLSLATEVLKRLVNSVPGYSVAWTAIDGAEAVKKCASDVPDAILMDLVMPVMDGVESTRQIMQGSPCPIFLVTSSVSTNFNKVYQAMGFGALDAVDTPVFGPGGVVQGGEKLLSRLEKLRLTKIATPTAPPPVSDRIWTKPTLDYGKLPFLVGIGVSTGGPNALSTILKALPKDLKAHIAIVQHIAAEFAPNLVNWLQAQCALPVRPATEGMEPKAGEVVIAVTDQHLVLRSDRCWGYTPHPTKNPYRPSVDVFFNSLAANYSRPSIGVILTGMQSDGASGLLRLRNRGWHTIAQDKESSVVYGMPKAAAEMGAAKEILSLNQIGPAICRVVKELA